VRNNPLKFVDPSGFAECNSAETCSQAGAERADAEGKARADAARQEHLSDGPDSEFFDFTKQIAEGILKERAREQAEARARQAIASNQEANRSRQAAAAQAALTATRSAADYAIRAAVSGERGRGAEAAALAAADMAQAAAQARAAASYSQGLGDAARMGQAALAPPQVSNGNGGTGGASGLSQFGQTGATSVPGNPPPPPVLSPWEGVAIIALAAAPVLLAEVLPAAEGGAEVDAALTQVSRWGRPGLESGDWVMKGGPNWWNYIWSGKWQPGLGNQFARFNSGESFLVPKSSLVWPVGWGIDGFFKGVLGQRWYLP
jgi:hypothetical protein